jgi:serine phosphatase RsbU (regulator of sigma subunit)/lipopolysaccharide biosynthesis regulator YciM
MQPRFVQFAISSSFLRALQFFLLFFSSSSFAQNIDSLNALLNSGAADTSRIRLHTTLSGALFTVDIDQSFFHAYKALQIAQKISSEQGLDAAYTNLGCIHSEGSSDSSLAYFFKAEPFKKKAGNKKGLANLYINIGNEYDKNGNAELSMKYYMESVKLYESLDIDKGVAGASLGLGNVFVRLKNYTKAIEYYRKSVEMYAKIDSPYQSWAMNNLANCYEQLGQTDKAMSMYKESLNIKLKNKDYYGAVFSLDDIGLLLLAQKEYKEALGYFQRALELNREHHLSSETFASTYSNIASAMLKLSRNSLARRYIDSLGFAMKQMNLHEHNLRFLKLNAEYFENTQDFKKAFEYHKRFTALNDSLVSSEMTQQMVEADARYMNEKKQKDIELLQKDKAIQNIEIEKNQSQRNAFIVGFGVVVLMLIFIFRGYRQKQKDNVLITQQKKEVETQKHLVEEKQKEIIDSINYAKRIQNTLLAHADFLKENIPNNFVLFKPKDIVSGDFYWATKKDQRFYIAACDSTGHGVPGAFMSLLNIGFLTEAINEQNIVKPNEIMNYVRQRLIDGISKEGQKDGFDGILVCIDQKANKITYSAAHNAPLLIRNEQIIELTKDKMPVGQGEKNDSFTLHEIELESSDTLYLYTDGYADQFGGPKGKKFLYKKLNELLLALNPLNMAERAVKLDHEFEKWKGSLEQVDDVLIIGIKV